MVGDVFALLHTDIGTVEMIAKRQLRGEEQQH